MKPRTAAAGLLMLLLASILGTTASSSTTMASQPTKQENITFTTVISPPHLSKTHGHDVIRIQGSGMTTKVGKPMVPVKIVPILLPPNADIKDIKLISSEKENLRGNYQIFPTQHPATDIESKSPKFAKPDPAVYKSDRAYPGILFENAGIQWMEGYKILNIRIFPIQYFPKHGKVTYYKSMKFTVAFTSNGLPPSKNTASNIKKMISTVVANPEKTEVWMSPSGKPISSPTIDYVIITSPSLQDEFQALANWKIESGISAQVYSTTWIYNNYAGADNQEKIRNFIIEMHNNHATSMVLLGGDYNIVPPRYIYMEDCLNYASEAGGGLTAHYKPTDYYYACLDGDWDPDHDGKYLEQTDTDLDGYPETCVEPIPDFYPEVYVGRMPATSEVTAEFLVNRTINYEKNSPPGDWKNKALLLGAISNYQNEDGKIWYQKTDDAKEQEWVKNNLLGEYNVITIYEKGGISPSTYAGTYPLTQNNVQTSLSSGCWIMSTAGHGSVQEQWRKIWAWDNGNGVPEYYEMNWIPFIDTTAMTLSNGEQLPQVYMDACINGKFDDTSSDCVAEWLVKLNGGGAIGVTAASRISYYCIGWQKGWPWNQELLCLFWQKFLNPTNEYRPGKALYESKLAYYLEGFDMAEYASKKNLLIYNLLGDPDLRRAVSHGPPEISILSPENTTYTASTVPLTFTINEPASWIGYSLDSQANVTISGNTTITGLSEGTHNVIVYANDTTGNMGSSDIVYFTVDTKRQYNFDFGTASSPVETGYTRITPSTLYSITSGYGWNSSTWLYSRDRGSPDDLKRDLVFSGTDQTFCVDLPNGQYQVTLIVGDQSYTHDKIDVYAEASLVVNDLYACAGTFREVAFVATVNDGQLSITFHDDGGPNPHWVINALTVEQTIKFDFGTEGSPVEPGCIQVLTSTSYSESTGFGWADTADLYARDRGAPDSLRRDFVFSSSNRTFKIDLPDGKYVIVIIIGDNSYSHDRIDIYCEGFLAANDLTVEKGYFAEVAFLPEVSDGQLEIMFCNDGGVDLNWVVNSIHVKTTFDLRLELDFGTGSSPVEDGCVRVTPTATYLSSTSYGWSDVTSLQSRDRGAPDALRRDFVFSSVDCTFNVDLPNGQYQVTLKIGDQSFMHDRIDIYAEGVLAADDLTASAGTFTEITFTVTVSDGQLNITFHDDGGVDVNWVINSMTVESYLE